MLKIRDGLYVGNSEDEKLSVYYHKKGLVDQVLVTAHDMEPINGWYDGIGYNQVALVDGPGNQLAMYHAAVLVLLAMTKTGKVLVCCHSGGRALAVVIMYLYLLGDGPSWDEQVARLKSSDGKGDVPSINPVHRKAFFMMDWGMMERVVSAEVSDG